MSRQRIAIIISVFPILLGLGDVLLRVIYLNSLSEGLYFALHDPGRLIHNLIIFPISTFLLVNNFPLAALKPVFLKYRVFSLSFFILFEFFGVCQAYRDAIAAYCVRTPMAYDITGNRDELVKLHHFIISGIQHESSSASNIKNAKETYLQLINKARGIPPDFWGASTFYSKYSLLLTCVALTYGGFVFTVIALFALSKKKMDDTFFKVIVINIIIFSPWFILRAYSEWFINLGDFKIQDDSKFLTIPFNLLVLTLVVFFLHHRKKLFLYIATLLAVLFSLTMMVAQLNPGLIFFPVKLSFALSAINRASVIFISSFGLGAIIWNLKNKSEPPDIISDHLQPESLPEQAPQAGIANPEPEPAPKFNLPDVLSNQYIDNIKNSLVTQKLYLDPELTLNKLAKQLKIPSHHLSFVLNEKMGHSFSDFINGYRVEAAKQKLKDPALKNIKVENIGYECGFNSKATFYRVFKKFCDQSPSEFQKPATAEVISN